MDGGPAFSTPVKVRSAFFSSAFSTPTIWFRVFQSFLFRPFIFHGPAFSIFAFLASPSLY